MRGGAEASLRILLDGLGRTDLRHVLFSLGNVQPGQDPRIVPVSFFRFVPRRVKIFGLHVLDSMLSSEVSRLVDHYEVDLLHVQDTYSLCGSVAAAEASGIPIILSYHNNVRIPHARFGAPYPANLWLDKKELEILSAARRCTSVIANSAYIAKQLVLAGLPRESVRTVYIGGAVSNWTQNLDWTDHHSLRVLAPGRLQHHKGFQNLLLASKKLVSTKADIEVVIAGDGPYRRTLSHIASELGIMGHVKFTGHVNDQEMISLYDWSDVVVVPSIAPEPFGRVVVEAMSRGKPVIGSNIGGIPEIIDDSETGFLVQPNNALLIAEKLALFRDEDKLQVRMGREALRRARDRFDQLRITRQVIETYEEIRSLRS
jgi:glycosyltransferase involved in cell wall biosynthesis